MLMVILLTQNIVGIGQQEKFFQMGGKLQPEEFMSFIII